MRNIPYHILLSFLSLLAGCSVPGFEEGDTVSDVPDGTPVVIDGAFVSGEKSAATRAMGETPEITSLYAIVFDENDLLSEIVACQPGTYENPQTTFTPDGGALFHTPFHVVLQSSSKTRIVHLVANIEPHSYAITDEVTLMKNLVVSGTTDAYWRRTADRDSIMQLVAESPLNEKEGYVYSDLGFMLLADVVQFISGMPIDLYVREHFYHPMGLRSIGYMPRETGWTDLWHIAPTEVDTVRGLVWGQVHDPNAWALGGVSGHAGLFANARDVAQLMQMLLNGGVYEGRRYLKPETIALFTRRHFADRKNRRALGFDKQLFTPSASAQVCPQATQSSYGHTGFTGTMLWVDPDRDLVFVFLSNRVHPSSTPNRLAQMNVRTDLQSIVYEAINKQQSSKNGWTSMGSR